MKFVPDQHEAIAGFWHTTLGARVVGTLETMVPRAGSRKAFYVVRVDALTTVKSRDGELRSSKVGERVGVSAFRKLEGLARYIGHHVRIELTKIETLPTGRQMFLFDVDVSDQPATEPHDNSEPVADGDIPF